MTLAATSADWAQYLAIAAVICVFTDVFFKSDLLTHVAYALLVVSLVLVLRMPWHWEMLLAFPLWVGLIVAHYLVWRNYFQPWLHDVVAPQRYGDRANSIIGLSGKIESVDGQTMVRINDELWPCETSGDAHPGQMVEVRSNRGGVLRVSISGGH